ncbi:hypothetical protein VNI00_007699 [Paramarasmius palmivorus]|uniref:MYND-type domain-containing protein n=1 Tax=Paramarasmius palmivorus TaxID=297713 RepID=A0AAW0CZU1_9AGAR
MIQCCRKPDCILGRAPYRTYVNEIEAVIPYYEQFVGSGSLYTYLTITFPETERDLGRPSLAAKQALGAILIVTASQKTNPSQFERLWPCIRDQLFTLLKFYPLRDSTSRSSEAIAFKEYLIYATTLIIIIFKTSGRPHVPAREAISRTEAAPFLVYTLDTVLHLSGTENPAFEIVWRIWITYRDAAFSHPSYAPTLNRLVKEYDIADICVRRLVAAVNRQELDFYLVDNAIMLSSFYSNAAPNMMLNMVAKNVVNWVPLLLLTSVITGKQAIPLMYKMTSWGNPIVVNSLVLLKKAFYGPTWVIEALDGHLLVSIAKLACSDSSPSNPQETRSYLNLFPAIRPYMVCRSVLRRVNHELETIDRSGLLVRNNAIHAALEILKQDCLRIKEDWILFQDRDIPKGYGGCRNSNCPRKQNPSNPPERLAFKCSGCKVALYCSQKCQKQSWKNVHREECKNYQPDEPGQYFILVQIMKSLTSVVEGLSYRMTRLDFDFLRFLVKKTMQDKCPEIVQPPKKKSLLLVIEADCNVWPIDFSTHTIPWNHLDIISPFSTDIYNREEVGAQLRIHSPCGTLLHEFLFRVEDSED